ncbi:SPOR domain-containing protein [Rheinheimera sp. D18]|uniref:SPOR domain-containing protein n=1 Tax=Rheinheimera sp. D18 TaxID=2545632 RepID=UPI001404F522|nr:SPOR domain-containing protein [Rheinheimera sp. D18]
MAGDNTNSTGLTDTEIKQYLLEWQEAKPGIARLTELESDLAFLIAEVNKMSDLNSTPEKYAAEGNNVVNGDNVIVAKMVPPSDEAVAVEAETRPVEPAQHNMPLSTEYAVHVASFLKPKSANFGWYVIQQEYPTLMQGLIPKLQQIKQRNQQLYSLRVGPFLTNQQAYNACNLLKRKNYQCQLTTFDGITLDL